MIRLITLTSLLFFSLNCFSMWSRVFEKNGIRVYASGVNKGIIPFKAISILDVDIDMLFEYIVDHKSKHKWSPKLKTVIVHEKLNDKEFIFSEYYKTPWPATDREFLLHGRINRPSPDKFILSASSINRPDLMAKDHVQADVRKILFIAEKINKNKSKVTFEFEGDLKGWLPTWLVNIIQKKWPYKFLYSLEKYSKRRIIKN